MADTLAVNLKASVDWLFKETLDLSSVADVSSLVYQAPLADGTAADLADKIWHDQMASIAAAATTALDLTALTSTIFGSSVTINFAKVKAILIVNLATVAGEKLQIDTTVANGFTSITGGAAGKIEIGPDSACLLCNKKDGWATSGANKVLGIKNVGAAAQTPKIVIVGTSA